MRRIWWTLTVVLTFCGVDAAGQAPASDPHIGYRLSRRRKAGNDVSRLTIGGQSTARRIRRVHLRRGRAREGHPGVSAGIRHRRGGACPLSRIRSEQSSPSVGRNSQGTTGPKDLSPAEALARSGLARDRKHRNETESSEESAKPPAHPLLYDLEEMSLRELVHAVSTFRSLRGGQRNLQLASTVLLEVSIDRDATPGERELRLSTRPGADQPAAVSRGRSARDA